MRPDDGDRYANLMKDPVMEAYFSQLPPHIREQIHARKQQPATLEELQRMADQLLLDALGLSRRGVHLDGEDQHVEFPWCPCRID